jgi:ferric-dicitrate binding protein FerR (iron transport regulator)
MSDAPQPTRDPLAALIHDAGRREAPPVQAYERTLRAVTNVWDHKVRRRRRYVLGAMAAGVAAFAVGATVLLESFDAPPQLSESAAQIARVIGDVRVRTHEGWSSVQEERGSLEVGAVLRTEPASAIALQSGAVSVRVAGNTEILLESRSRLRLKSGKVYLDAGAGSAEGQMLVVSDAGSVAHVGTQFQVLYEDRRLQVQVREGRVMVHSGDWRRHAVAGDEINIDSSGAISHTSLEADDSAWRWVESLALAPDIDDQPLSVLLTWVARETGRAVRYATPAIERKATTTILHGSIRSLEPLEALALMLATTDLRYEEHDDGTIMIK